MKAPDGSFGEAEEAAQRAEDPEAAKVFDETDGGEKPFGWRAKPTDARPEDERLEKLSGGELLDRYLQMQASITSSRTRETLSRSLRCSATMAWKRSSGTTQERRRQSLTSFASGQIGTKNGRSPYLVASLVTQRSRRTKISVRHIDAGLATGRRSSFPSMHFESSKVVDGFSTCFRQWRAVGTHCRFLHGYDISFKLWFRGELDERNWVQNFGFLKDKQVLVPLSNGDQGTIGDWFKDAFDHTTVIAQDDPLLQSFQQLAAAGGCQLRVVDSVGCESFARMVFERMTSFLAASNSRVTLFRVDCREHDKNEASCVL